MVGLAVVRDGLLDGTVADGAERLVPAGEHDAVDRGAIEPLRGIARPLEGADLARQGAGLDLGVDAGDVVAGGACSASALRRATSAAARPARVAAVMAALQASRRSWIGDLGGVELGLAPGGRDRECPGSPGRPTSGPSGRAAP